MALVISLELCLYMYVCFDDAMAAMNMNAHKSFAKMPKNLSKFA